MRDRLVMTFLASWGLLGWLSAGAAAAPYSTYTENGTEIIASSSRRAEEIAHHIARFHKALATVLPSQDVADPIHLYELQPADAILLGGSHESSLYSFSGYDTTIVTTAEADAGNGDWGALFGYAGGIIVTGRALRCPFWFELGLPQVFSHTRFESGRLLTGGIVASYVQTLLIEKAIPSRVFFNIREGDDRLKDAQFEHRYEAQSWYIAYEIFVQGLLRSEFNEYLKRLQDGETEADAFSPAFPFGYEELDLRLMKAMHDPPHLYVVKVPSEITSRGSFRELSVAESRGRIAGLLLARNRPSDAARVAGEGLEADPRDELALRMMARAQLLDGKYDAALRGLDQLDSLSTLSAAALTDVGEISAALARAVAAKRASIAGDAGKFNGRAAESFEHALRLDTDYLRAWAGLADLYGGVRDVPAAEAFIDRAKPVVERHPSADLLARSLARMAAQTGQFQAARLFGELWCSSAFSMREMDQAKAFMASLETH